MTGLASSQPAACHQQSLEEGTTTGWADILLLLHPSSRCLVVWGLMYREDMVPREAQKVTGAISTQLSGLNPSWEEGKVSQEV